MLGRWEEDDDDKDDDHDDEEDDNHDDKKGDDDQPNPVQRLLHLHSKPLLTLVSPNLLLPAPPEKLQ